jgi:hypothetical protein
MSVRFTRTGKLSARADECWVESGAIKIPTHLHPYHRQQHRPNRSTQVPSLHLEVEVSWTLRSC